MGICAGVRMEDVHSGYMRVRMGGWEGVVGIRAGVKVPLSEESFTRERKSIRCLSSLHCPSLLCLLVLLFTQQHG